MRRGKEETEDNTNAGKELDVIQKEEEKDLQKLGRS